MDKLQQELCHDCAIRDPEPCAVEMYLTLDVVCSEPSAYIDELWITSEYVVLCHLDWLGVFGSPSANATIGSTGLRITWPPAVLHT